MKDLPKKYNIEIEDLIKKFNTLQEERARTYGIFEEGIKNYLLTRPNYDFISYREVVNEVTNEFKKIAEEIIDIEKRLREEGVTDISDLILAVQDCEKRKLHMTVEHHLSRQMVADSEDKEAEKNIERSLRKQLGEVVEEINDHLIELRYVVYED